MKIAFSMERRFLFKHAIRSQSYPILRKEAKQVHNQSQIHETLQHFEFLIALENQFGRIISYQLQGPNETARYVRFNDEFNSAAPSTLLGKIPYRLAGLLRGGPVLDF